MSSSKEPEKKQAPGAPSEAKGGSAPRPRPPPLPSRNREPDRRRSDQIDRLMSTANSNSTWQPTLLTA